MTQELTTHNNALTALAVSAHDIKAQVNLIQEVMRSVMKPGEHYGKIPGCGDKPTLLKPGAEKLMMTFRLSSDIDVTSINLPNGHREERVKVTLYSPDGQRLGTGVGSCSTMESKYRYRNAGYTCPECGEIGSVNKGRAEYGGGWFCNKKKGGCGAKFADGDQLIEGQVVGKIEHDNPADYHNTVLKVSKKRGLVDAVLTTTAASDIFTQDIEDGIEATVPAQTATPAMMTEAQSKEISDLSTYRDIQAEYRYTTEKKYLNRLTVDMANQLIVWLKSLPMKQLEQRA